MHARTLFLLLVSGSAHLLSAQPSSNAFAITGKEGALLWENIYSLDLGRAKITGIVYDKQVTAFHLLSAQTKKPVEAAYRYYQGKKYMEKQDPTTTMVAAAAYDALHGKLFFAPMRINELRWIDLRDNTPVVKVYTVDHMPLIQADVEQTSNQITRMCMGADGYGYAMSNDALHLIRFSTGTNLTITDLGSVVSEKNDITINNACGGWGGDMVADTRGNLYVISANHYVFKVNIETRLASFVTRLNDIPATYSVNGAAVDEEGNLILGSANSTDGFYKVNPVNWKVDKLQNAGEKLNVSDLASSYFLFDNRNTKTTQTFNDIREVYNEKIAAYPNPVTEAVIKVSFDQLPKGKYAMDLVDLTGRLLTSKNITVTAASQLETIMLDSKAAKGLYLLRVTNNDQKIVFVKKMFVQ